MGSHRTHISNNTVGREIPFELPPWPSSKGKRKPIKNIRGETRHLLIRDEIRRVQSNAPDKLIVFQMIEIEEDRQTQFRLGYYMIGVKPGAKGRWVWGQFCLLIPAEDLHDILNEARERKWL